MFFDELPDEITLRILQLLPTAKDLVAVKRVSKTGQRLSMDESAWLEQLKNDFYFTNETAKANSNRLKKNYAEFYHYCVNYQLDDYEKSIVDAFQANGLKPEHLKGRNFHTKYFDYVDQNFQSLRYLMRERQPAMSAKDAIAEIDGLSDWQLRGIKESLSRAEVLGMDIYQVNTLLMLKPKGLRAEHLKEEGINWGDVRFHNALLYLMDFEMDAANAIATLKWLSVWQAHGISKGLSLIEVSKLNNEHQVDALIKLKPHGLKAEHLADQDWFAHGHYYDALVYLMIKRQPVMKAEEAMAELDGLSLKQAIMISYGLSREEVLKESAEPVDQAHPTLKPF